MSVQQGACFSPEEIEVLRRVLDSAWAKMSRKEQLEHNRSGLAVHILKLAADGERDPSQLCEYALRRTRQEGCPLDMAV
jgi:hypothetical protein